VSNYRGWHQMKENSIKLITLFTLKWKSIE
jgi:hypothetical protein